MGPELLSGPKNQWDRDQILYKYRTGTKIRTKKLGLHGIEDQDWDHEWDKYQCHI